MLSAVSSEAREGVKALARYGHGSERLEKPRQVGFAFSCLASSCLASHCCCSGVPAVRAALRPLWWQVDVRIAAEVRA